MSRQSKRIHLKEIRNDTLFDLLRKLYDLDPRFHKGESIDKYYLVVRTAATIDRIFRVLAVSDSYDGGGNITINKNELSRILEERDSVKNLKKRILIEGESFQNIEDIRDFLKSYKLGSVPREFKTLFDERHHVVHTTDAVRFSKEELMPIYDAVKSFVIKAAVISYEDSWMSEDFVSGVMCSDSEEGVKILKRVAEEYDVGSSKEPRIAYRSAQASLILGEFYNNLNGYDKDTEAGNASHCMHSKAAALFKESYEKQYNVTQSYIHYVNSTADSISDDDSESIKGKSSGPLSTVWA